MDSIVSFLDSPAWRSVLVVWLVIACAAVAAGTAVALARLRRYEAAGQAVWLQISAPAVLPAEGGVALWRMLAGCLHRTSRTSRGGGGGVLGGLFAPGARLAVEWWADPSGIRPGVWVPPSISPERVADAIRRAWPGAAVTPTTPPLWHVPPAATLRLAPTRGPWAPLLDPTTRAQPRPTTATATAMAAGAGEEPLRAVLGALGGRWAGEQACVQLVITPRRGVLCAAWATVLPRALAPALLGTLAGCLALVVLGVLDLITPGRSSLTPDRRGRGRAGSSDPAGASDPAVVAARTALDAKRAAGPHLGATLRIAVSTPTRTRTGRGRRRGGRRGHDDGRARAIAADIAAGFDLITTATPLHGRWITGGEPVMLRTPYGLSGGFVATLAELAALWHLPSWPDLYQLPPAGTTQRRPGLTLPRAGPIRRADTPAPRVAGPGPGRASTRPPGHPPHAGRPPGTPPRPVRPPRPAGQPPHHPPPVT